MGNQQKHKIIFWIDSGWSCFYLAHLVLKKTAEESGSLPLVITTRDEYAKHIRLHYSGSIEVLPKTERAVASKVFYLFAREMWKVEFPDSNLEQREHEQLLLKTAIGYQKLFYSDVSTLSDWFKRVESNPLWLGLSPIISPLQFTREVVRKITRVLRLIGVTPWILNRLAIQFDHSTKLTEIIHKQCATKPLVIMEAGLLSGCYRAELNRLNAQILHVIPSWDRVNTNGVLPYRANHHAVWGPLTARDIVAMTDATSSETTEVGAPSLDAYDNVRNILTREEFVQKLGISSSKKIWLFSFGQGRFETMCAGILKSISQCVEELCLEDSVQILVRYYPFRNDMSGIEHSGTHVIERPYITHYHPEGGFEWSLPSWVADTELPMRRACFEHADIVFNPAGSSMFDAFCFSKPVIYTLFDSGNIPAHQSATRLLRRMHVRYSMACRGISFIGSPDELRNAIEQVMNKPEVYTEHIADALKDIRGRSRGNYVENMVSLINRLVSQ